MPLKRISDLDAVSALDPDSLIEVSEPTGGTPPYVSKRATAAAWVRRTGDTMTGELDVQAELRGGDGVASAEPTPATTGWAITSNYDEGNADWDVVGAVTVWNRRQIADDFEGGFAWRQLVAGSPVRGLAIGRLYTNVTDFSEFVVFDPTNPGRAVGVYFSPADGAYLYVYPAVTTGLTLDGASGGERLVAAPANDDDSNHIATTSWVRSQTVDAWSVDLDFTTGIYWNSPYQPTSPIVCSRASVGYIDTAAGVWSQVAANTLRRSDKGALIEEARTNGVRNNSMQSAAAGTPGTLPTNWAQNLGAGITRQIVGTGTSNGIDYIEVRYSGTLSSGSQVVTLFFDSTTGIAAATGQTWVNSAFVSLVGGSVSGLTSIVLGWNENTSGGSFVASKTGADFKASLTSSLQRFQHSAANTGGGTVAVVMPWIAINAPTSTVIDLTLRIGWPQMEQGSWASSPIRTTSAAATRAADVVSLALPPIFGTGHTLAGAGTPVAPITAGAQTLIEISDTTTANRFAIYRQATSGIPAWIMNSTTIQIGSTAWAQSAAGILVGANSPTHQAGSFNGADPTAGANSTTITGLSLVRIGGNLAGAVQWNGYIERVLIWPETLLSDTAVENIATDLPDAAGWVATAARPGTTTDDNADTGYVGEFQSSVILTGSAVSLTSATAANITSLSLTAGDWDVEGEVWFTPAGTTTVTQLVAAINTTSATVPTTPAVATATAVRAGRATAGGDDGAILPTGVARISIASTTTVYLVVRSTFATSTMSAYGMIRARRVR